MEKLIKLLSIYKEYSPSKFSLKEYYHIDHTINEIAVFFKKKYENEPKIYDEIIDKFENVLMRNLKNQGVELEIEWYGVKLSTTEIIEITMEILIFNRNNFPDPGGKLMSIVNYVVENRTLTYVYPILKIMRIYKSSHSMDAILKVVEINDYDLYFSELVVEIELILSYHIKIKQKDTKFFLEANLNHKVPEIANLCKKFLR